MSKKEKIKDIIKTIWFFVMIGILLAVALAVVYGIASIPGSIRFHEYLEQHKELNQQINRLEEDTVAWRKRYRALSEEIQVRNEHGMDYRDIEELYGQRSEVGLQIQRNEGLLENLILVANELRAKYDVPPRVSIFDCNIGKHLRNWKGNC